MAKISGINMSVQRDSFSVGSICTIKYSYMLQCDSLELENKMGYVAWCELWGKELLGDKLLGDAAFDVHNLKAGSNVRMSREFTVPCAILNERVGEDVLYIKVKAVSTLGVEIEAVSPDVRDAF